MKQWDIYTWEFPHGTHPAVILTPDAWLHSEEINILDCSTHRAQRPPEKHEVLLDEADGLDWATLCRCHRIFLAKRSELRARRGSVTDTRRRQIGEKLIRVFGLLP